jgi:hypothetical protein
MIFWISILAWNDAFSHNDGSSKQILTYFFIWFSRFDKSNRVLPIFSSSNYLTPNQAHVLSGKIKSKWKKNAAVETI